MRRALLCLAGVVALLFALPQVFQAERFRRAIHRGLEESLGRRVEINGAIAYLLVPRPGFSASDVVIHEHPSVGVEPFAYVGTLDFHVSLTGLLRGRVDLAGIRLDEPHINLMKPHESTWNVQPFLDHALGPKGSGATLPAIEVSNGRLNFKHGDTKSTYFLDATDLVIEADSDNPNRYGIKFVGEPARTDRSARALGRLTGRGMLEVGRSSGAESRIDLSLASDRTAVSEIITLIEGRSIGVRGFATSRLRLAGPLSAIGIDGRVDLAEFDRIGWLPAGSGGGIQVRGKLDLPGQELSIETVPPPDRAPAPVSMRARASQLLGSPRWAAVANVSNLPLSALQPGAGGTLAGAVGYSTSRGFQGSLMAVDATIRSDDLPAIRVEQGMVTIDGNRVSLRGATLRIGESRSAAVDAAYQTTTGLRDVAIQTGGLELAELRPLWRALAGRPLPEWMERSASGIVSGSLRCARCNDDAQWSADVSLKGLGLSLEGLPGEVQLDSALASLRGGAVAVRRLDARIGGMRLRGEVSIDAAGRARFRLEAPEATLAQLESFVAPAFQRQQGIVARTLGRTAPLPEWLSARDAEGTLAVAVLHGPGGELTESRCSVAWKGPSLVVRDWSAKVGDGSVKGRLAANLEGREPVYKGHVELARFPWQEGEMDSAMDLQTSGSGAQLGPRLRLTGTFAARDFTLAPDTEWRQASGAFAYTGAAAQRLQLTGIEAAIGPDSYQGQGASNAEGRLTVELTSAQRQLRLAGRISGLQVELAPAR